MSSLESCLKSAAFVGLAAIELHVLEEALLHDTGILQNEIEVISGCFKFTSLRQ